MRERVAAASCAEEEGEREREQSVKRVIAPREKTAGRKRRLI